MSDLAASLRELLPEPATAVEKLEEFLSQEGLDLEDLGTVSTIKVTDKDWQGFYKDAEGTGHKVDMSGRTTAFVLHPEWATGPKWDPPYPADPVRITPAKVKQATTKTADEDVLVLPDTQIGYRRDLETADLRPFHSEAAMDIALQVARDTQPSKVVLLGDLLDLPEFSRFAKEPGFALTFRPAIQRATRFLASLRASCPHAEIVVIEGNHDRRLLNAVNTNLQAAYGVKRGDVPDLQLFDTFPVFSIPFLLRMEDLGVQYVEGYPAGIHWLNKGTACVHGDVHRSNGSTAAAVVDRENVSIVLGHVHRLELQYRTVREHDGPRRTFAASPGCLCRTTGPVPSVRGSWDSNGNAVEAVENWQQGFAYLTVERDGYDADVDLVEIKPEGYCRFRGERFEASVGDDHDGLAA